MAENLDKELQKALDNGDVPSALKILKGLSEEELAQLDPKLRKKLEQAIEQESASLSPDAADEKKAEYEKEVSRLAAVDLAFQNSPKAEQNPELKQNPELAPQQDPLTSVREALVPQLNTTQKQQAPEQGLEPMQEKLQVLTQEKSIAESIEHNRAPTRDETIAPEQQQPGQKPDEQNQQADKGKEDVKKEQPKEQKQQKPPKAKGLKGMMRELADKVTKPPKAKAPKGKAAGAENNTGEIEAMRERQVAALREREEKERVEEQAKSRLASAGNSSIMMAAALAIGNELKQFSATHGVANQMASADEGSQVVAKAASTETALVQPSSSSEIKIA